MTSMAKTSTRFRSLLRRLLLLLFLFPLLLLLGLFNLLLTKWLLSLLP